MYYKSDVVQRARSKQHDKPCDRFFRREIILLRFRRGTSCTRWSDWFWPSTHIMHGHNSHGCWCPVMSLSFVIQRDNCWTTTHQCQRRIDMLLSLTTTAPSTPHSQPGDPTASCFGIDSLEDWLWQCHLCWSTRGKWNQWQVSSAVDYTWTFRRTENPDKARIKGIFGCGSCCMEQSFSEHSRANIYEQF